MGALYPDGSIKEKLVYDSDGKHFHFVKTQSVQQVQ
jgi:hypothetical protein